MNAMTNILSMDNDLSFDEPLLTFAPKYAPAILEHNHMRGRLETREAIVKFIEAGNATCTIVSKSSGKRITFKFSRPDEQPNRQRPIFVNVLTGSDNNSDYTFAGTIWINPTGYHFNLSKKTNLTMSAPSMLALAWLLKSLNTGADEKMLRQAEFWHEGRCGRCGRKLTVPQSIESGFGPDCITMI